jgi:SEC-C motif
MIPRNAPCPCGSGRRYKICHGEPGLQSSLREDLALLELGLAARPLDAGLRRSLLSLLVNAQIPDDWIGGSATTDTHSVRVAVVTAYHRESLDLLQRCHESVAAQTYPCRHFMVADGVPQDALDAWDVQHIRLDHAHADYGDTPRAIGGEAAVAQGFTAIAYLDADNTYRSRHVESLVSRHLITQAPVCFSERTLHLPDGRWVPLVLPDDNAGHIDTSCVMIAGKALSCSAGWREHPRQLSVVGDRVFLQVLRARGFAFAGTGSMTARYTVREVAFFRALGLPIPEMAADTLDLRGLADWYRGLDLQSRAALDAQLGYPLRGLLQQLFVPRGMVI